MTSCWYNHELLCVEMAFFLKPYKITLARFEFFFCSVYTTPRPHRSKKSRISSKVKIKGMLWLVCLSIPLQLSLLEHENCFYS